MKKGILIGLIPLLFVLLLMFLTVCLGSTSDAPKYWQDVILKPEQAWIEAYGYNNESILAYNVRSLIQIAQQQEKVIAALKKEMDVDIYKFIPTWPDYIELDKDLWFDSEHLNEPNKPPIYRKIAIGDKGTKIYFKDPNGVK